MVRTKTLLKWICKLSHLFFLSSLKFCVERYLTCFLVNHFDKILWREVTSIISWAEYHIVGWSEEFEPIWRRKLSIKYNKMKAKQAINGNICQQVHYPYLLVPLSMPGVHSRKSPKRILSQSIIPHQDASTCSRHELCGCPPSEKIPGKGYMYSRPVLESMEELLSM